MKLSRTSFLTGMAAIAAAGITTPARAQFPIPTPGDLVRGATERAKREAQRAAEETIAKTLFPLERENRTVLRQAPRKDGLEFKRYQPMKTLRRTPSGGFILKPGAWEFEAQSFCILAGTHERTGGAGYRAATLCPAKWPQPCRPSFVAPIAGLTSGSRTSRGCSGPS